MSDGNAAAAEPWGLNGLPRREEWDFSKVPDDELRGCCVWEYSRESQTIQNFKSEWATYQTTLLEEAGRGNYDALWNNSWAMDHPQSQKIASELQRLRFTPILLTLEKSACWQDLSAEDKSSVGYGYLRPLQFFEGFEKGRTVYPSKNKTEFIATFDWTASDNEMVEEFRKFLGENRPHDHPNPKPGRKAGTIKHSRALKSLGIMRVMNAITIQDDRFPLREFGEDRQGCYHHRLEAPENLRRIFPFLPASEMPLRFELFENEE